MLNLFTIFQSETTNQFLSNLEEKSKKIFGLSWESVLNWMKIQSLQNPDAALKMYLIDGSIEKFLAMTEGNKFDLELESQSNEIKKYFSISGHSVHNEFFGTQNYLALIFME